MMRTDAHERGVYATFHAKGTHVDGDKAARQLSAVAQHMVHSVAVYVAHQYTLSISIAIAWAMGLCTYVCALSCKVECFPCPNGANILPFSFSFPLDPPPIESQDAGQPWRTDMWRIELERYTLAGNVLSYINCSAYAIRGSLPVYAAAFFDCGQAPDLQGTLVA